MTLGFNVEFAFIFYGKAAAVGLGILIWMKTPGGKRWLKWEDERQEQR